MVSITKLAKDLNLSIGTVSRILNDPSAPYAAETRERVLQYAEEVGYIPNPVARALVIGRTDTVALWTHSLAGFYQSWVLRELSQQSDARAYHMLIRLWNSAQIRNMSGALSDTVDGVISNGVPPEAWLARIRKRSIPAVITGDSAAPGIPDFVGIDMRTAARQAMDHLLSLRRDRVALLTPPNPSDKRYEAYLDAMDEAGMPPEIIPITGGTILTEESRSQIRRQFREYVIAHGHPDAVFCHNDDTAIAAYRALCDIGLRVPEDVALVGCDGIEDTEFLPVPITTIVMPVQEMSRLAWQFLKCRMEYPDAPPQKVYLDATLEIRASSQP